MAIDRKISDLDNLPGFKIKPPQEGDYFLIAREDVNNYKFSYADLTTQVRKDVVFTTGNQTIEGQKTFDQTIIGNLEGYSKYVRDGLYITGDQEVGGVKTFTEFILGNVSGNLSGTAQYVVSGVYQTGDQTIYGVKSFEDDIFISGKSLESHIKYVISNKTEPIEKALKGIQKSGVFVTGNQYISGIKSFDSFISGNVSGNLSGTALYVQSGVYTSGDQRIEGSKDFVGDILISGKPIETIVNNAIENVAYLTGDQVISGVKTFDSFISGNISGNLSGTALYVQSGVYTSGDQSIEGRKDFQGDLFISGKPFTEYSTKLSPEDVLIITGFNQVVTGQKVFHDYLIPSGGITTTGDSQRLVIKSDPDAIVDAPTGALTISFEEGVYITGSDLHVEGKIFADEIESVDSIMGESGAMVFSDGRDPALFEGPDYSLSMAFRSGVFITGGADLHVEGKIYADEIEAVDSIVGESGAMVLTDGRDPALFEGPDASLSMAFKSGVFITGGADLHVEGKIFADEIEAIDSIVGESGSMVLTDGRDPALFEGPDTSLSMAFKSGVFITGGANLHVEGKIFADEIEAIDSIVGESGSMVLTDGRDPALFEGPDTSLALAFKSGVFVTGGADLHVEGKIFADEIEAIDSIVGESGSMVLTDGRDPALFEGPDTSLSMAFKSGVFITGGANLYVEGKIFADEIEAVDSLVGESGAMVFTDGRDPALFEGGDSTLSMSFKSGVFITGGAKLHLDEDLIISGKSFQSYINESVTEIQSNEKKTFLESYNSNFWWSSQSKVVYIPLSNSESPAIDVSTDFDAGCSNSENKEMGMNHVRKMTHKGKIKKISFSLTKTNPHGVPDPQFNIISGTAVDFDCEERSTCMTRLELLDQEGLTIESHVEKSNIIYPEWVDQFHIYSKMGASFPGQDCCYPNSSFDPNVLETIDGKDIEPEVGKLVVFLIDSDNFPIGTEGRIKSITTDPTHGLTYEIKNQTTSQTKLFRVDTIEEHSRGFRWEMKGTPLTAYNTPQKYITYSYEFINKNHYDEGTYIAVQMDKGGEEGPECWKGDIDQAVFVSMVFENEI